MPATFAVEQETNQSYCSHLALLSLLDEDPSATATALGLGTHQTMTCLPFKFMADAILTWNPQFSLSTVLLDPSRRVRMC